MTDSFSTPPQRVLDSSSSTAAPGEPATRFQRTKGAMRMAIPLVQRLLPLLDGNIGSAVSNLLNPHLPAPPPAPPVNLAPIENGLAELHAVHRDLRGHVLEQNLSLQRVEEQLELVREATDRNALAQQELMAELHVVGHRVEELKAMSQKAKVFALVILGLLVLSIAFNALLLLHFRRLLP